MKLTFEAGIGVALVLMVGVTAVGVIWQTFAESDTRADMERVEATLVFHGYPVEGFAQTALPDLELVDALAPAGCIDVWRTAHLAQLAILRQAKTPKLKAGSGMIGAATAIAYAGDTGRLDCVGLAP